MPILEQLAIALGAAGLAGVNLYLTVFITGLLVRFQWLDLAEQYALFEVLAHPAVLAVSGTLFAIEFFADKISYVDSLWDSIHTIIRPVGALLIAVEVLGDADPAMQVVGALLAGGVALGTHTAKASTRLAINASPEPFTNVAMSVGEDITILGGLYLLHQHPWVLAGLVIAFLCILIWLLPKLCRKAKRGIHKLKEFRKRMPWNRKHYAL